MSPTLACTLERSKCEKSNVAILGISVMCLCHRSRYLDHDVLICKSEPCVEVKEVHLTECTWWPEPLPYHLHSRDILLLSCKVSVWCSGAFFYVKDRKKTFEAAGLLILNQIICSLHQFQFLCDCALWSRILIHRVWFQLLGGITGMCRLCFQWQEIHPINVHRQTMSEYLDIHH